jgi:hypothetical protein
MGRRRRRKEEGKKGGEREGKGEGGIIYHITSDLLCIMRL